MDRRTFIKAATSSLGTIGAAGLLASCDNADPSAQAQSSSSDSGQSPSAPDIKEETKSLDELYRDALDEGGKLTVYAGGDTKDQQDGNANAFRKRFPEMDLQMEVDFSKYQDARIDLQIARDDVRVDVVQLQELQDFPDWKARGELLQYKPANYGHIYPKFRDPDSFWVSICVNSFANSCGPDVANPPKEINDYLDPRWKGKIILDYPNDDDATQFLFMKIVDEYGWEWVEKFMKQEPTFTRGGEEPVVQVGKGTYPVAMGVYGSLVPEDGEPVFSIPEKSPFMAWAQRAAILKRAKHPAAAKLYLNWWLSEEGQKRWYQWPVREDITPNGGYRPIWEYDNAYVDEFIETMEDRFTMERFRNMLTQIIGEPQGPPSSGQEGIYLNSGH